MELMRVLVVEDNSVVADAVAEGLRDEGIAVDVAYDGSAGLDKVTVNTYDVIVLDRDLPRLHGGALCQQIVDSPSTSRILMLTAAALVEDRVNGLNLGAHDYLAKPFDFSELVARVRALARRSPSTPPVLTRGDLIVDRGRRASAGRCRSKSQRPSGQPPLGPATGRPHDRSHLARPREGPRRARGWGSARPRGRSCRPLSRRRAVSGSGRGGARRGGAAFPFPQCQRAWLAP
jgi:CheY-like chemotaxis protein